VGARVAGLLAKHFGTMDRLREANVEELSGVPEIGPVIAQSVFDFLHSDFGREVIEDLTAAGVLMETPESERVLSDGAIAGKTIVVTGTLVKYKRDEIEALIARHGGRAASSVSKKTDFVVAGENAGSKLDKANSLGVRVISEAEFEGMVGGRK
jgi:DNA ligase (NAD+)